MVANYATVLDAPGDAPWLVMVHGMSRYHRVFSAQVQAFRRDHRILLVDLPGHRLSSDIPGPYGHVEMAAHVDAAWTTPASIDVATGPPIRARQWGCFWRSETPGGSRP
jgi:pimeloyl-ACP methyl ester carboxylesterase